MKLDAGRFTTFKGYSYLVYANQTNSHLRQLQPQNTDNLKGRRAPKTQFMGSIIFRNYHKKVCGAEIFAGVDSEVFQVRLENQYIESKFAQSFINWNKITELKVNWEVSI